MVASGSRVKNGLLDHLSNGTKHGNWVPETERKHIFSDMENDIPTNKKVRYNLLPLVIYMTCSLLITWVKLIRSVNLKLH